MPLSAWEIKRKEENFWSQIAIMVCFMLIGILVSLPGIGDWLLTVSVR